jgi:hypothetical protein
MSKKEKLEDYEVFYVEIPPAEYMDDIEIQDEHDNTSYEQVRGLSDHQVSQIADDSLDATNKQKSDKADDHMSDPG